MGNVNEKKPDYTDRDWTPLIRERTQKWKEMMENVKKDGWEIIPLRDFGGFQSSLALPPLLEEKRGMLIVCAGGGFLFKTPNEALPVAEFFRHKGVNTAILDYHVGTMDTPSDQIIEEAGEDGLAAIRYLREHAGELSIYADKIAIGGFSAGGMLSAYAATHFMDEPDGISSRPDAALVLYGAFSISGTREPAKVPYVAGEQARLSAVDPIRNITPAVPPMFLFQTHKDDPRHILEFGHELAVKGVPFEMHTFENGPHGGGLFDGGAEDTPFVEHTNMWPDIAADWLKMRGFCG